MFFMETNSQQLNTQSNDDKIHGWLVMYLACCILGGALSIFSNIQYIDFSNNTPGFGWLVFADFLRWIFHAGICFYTFDSFVKRRNTAVFWGKWALITYIFSNIVVLIRGDYPFEWVGSVKGVLFALVWGVVWYVYLCKSEQVNRLIPKEVQKPGKKEWIILAAGLVTPWIVALFAVFSMMQ